MGTHPIFESDFDRLTEIVRNDKIMSLNSKSICQRYGKERRFDESDRSLLSRLLTVRCNGANLTKIGDLSELTNLVKLYVRDNQITSISSVSTAPKLTHLYIIDNFINELASITRLSHLEKLYAGRNRIQIIEGLANLDNLLELHLESQQLDRGEKLHIEPASLSALKWLKVLNISNNNIDNLEFVNNLQELRTLRCQDNQIDQFAELTHLNTCIRLNEVDLLNNPLTRQNRYRDNVIINVKQLRLLDGKDIAPNERDFVTKWHEHRQQQHQIALSREVSKVKSRQSLDDEALLLNEPIYHQSDISHLASGLPSGIDNLVRLIRKQHTANGAVEPSPSAPQFATENNATLHQADLHKTFSFGATEQHQQQGITAQLHVDGGGGEDPHRVTPIPVEAQAHEAEVDGKKNKNNEEMHIIPYQKN